MTDDLRQRLGRLATELTATSTVPPPAAIRRLGRRRRYRQLALVAVVAVALAGLAAGPGGGLLGRDDAPAGVAGPATTVAAPALRPPQVAEGRFAAVIEDPPAGFPQRLSGRVTGCSGIDMPGRSYRLLVIGEVKYRGRLMVVNVLPWPAVKEPPLQPRNLQAPWAVVSRLRLDAEDFGSPDLVAERPQTRLDLDRADGTKGSIVGAYRVVQFVHRGSTSTAHTVRDLTGAQLAMAWNCKAKP
jgi:hypothetical protein